LPTHIAFSKTASPHPFMQTSFPEHVLPLQFDTFSWIITYIH